MDLDSTDIKWFSFLNDCKVVELDFNMPPTILKTLRTTRQYAVTTPEGNYITFLINKIDYGISSSTDLIPVKIQLYVINNQPSTVGYIQAYPKLADTADILHPVVGVIKAYFTEALHGLTQLQVDVVSVDDNSRKFSAAPVVSPTDKKGFGGQGIYLLQTAGLPIGGFNSDGKPAIVEFRVKGANPQFMDVLGRRYYFSQRQNYFYTVVDLNLAFNYCTYWICF